MNIGNKNKRANDAWREAHPDGPDLPDDQTTDDGDGIDVYHDITQKLPPQPTPEDASLSFDQMRDLVGQGLPITEVRNLNEAGFTYTQIAQLAQAQVSARQAADQRTADAIQAGTSHAIAANQPKRHSREDSDYDRKSAYNPQGDREHPRPGLKCPMFWGIIDGTPDHPKPPIVLYDIEADSCTMEEQLALNKLEPVKTTFTRNDDQVEPIQIVPSHDGVTGEVTRLVIALRRDMYGKQDRGQLPPLRRLAKDLVA